jgi:hypothetical protein
VLGFLLMMPDRRKESECSLRGVEKFQASKIASLEGFVVLCLCFGFPVICVEMKKLSQYKK